MIAPFDAAAKFKIRRLALTLCVAYLTFCSVLFLLQRTLLYFPDKTAFVPSEWHVSELIPIQLDTGDGLKITSWYTPAKDQRKTVVFTQGNAGHSGYRNYKIRPWIDAGIGVMMVGYHGFATNPGEPSEQHLYADARAAINYLLTSGRLKLNDIILYGESVGTGVATQMATEFAVAGLVLESPYTSVTEVGASRYPFVPVQYLMFDRFESYKKIGKINMPLLIVHGLADEVVPARFGKKLFSLAKDPKDSLFVKGLGHNDIYGSEVRDRVMKFIEDIESGALTHLNKT